MRATLRITSFGVTALVVGAGLIGCQTMERLAHLGRVDRAAVGATQQVSASQLALTSATTDAASDTSRFGGTSIGYLPPGDLEEPSTRKVSSNRDRRRNCRSGVG